MKRFTRAYRTILSDPLLEFRLSEDEVTSVDWMKIDDVKKMVSNYPELVTNGLDQLVERYF
ncbi:MAG: hypothetical protein NVSMB39_2210 [Candidatus Saccharimonadales bacterium]